MNAHSKQTFSLASSTYMQLPVRLHIRLVQFKYNLHINVRLVSPAFRSSAEDLFKCGKAGISLFPFSEGPYLNSK